jgi:secreted trypsin-like serine protease
LRVCQGGSTVPHFLEAKRMHATTRWITPALLILAPLTGCGVETSLEAIASASQPIVRGDPVHATQFPWVAALALRSGGTWYEDQHCGGALIEAGAPRDAWILTAAHCLIDESGYPLPARSLRVGLGQRALSQLPSQLDGVSSFWVNEVHLHPFYDSGNDRFDVALLKLGAPPRGPRLRVARPGEALPVGAPVAVAGWGHTEVTGWDEQGAHMGGSYPVVMHWTSLAVVDSIACERMLDPIERMLFGRRATVVASQLCAASTSATAPGDSCYGDSGGPLVYRDPFGAERVVGVVVSGEGCGDVYRGQPLPGIYTRVSEVWDWIDRCARDRRECRR